MSFSYSVDHDNQLINIKWDGAFTLIEVNAALDGMYKSPEYSPHYKAIVDVRSATFSMTPAELAVNRKFVSSHPNRPTGACAVVCEEPMQTAYAMLYQKEENPSHITEVFSTFPAAKEWLSKAR